MKDIKTTLCTACKIYYEDIDYDSCPLCIAKTYNERIVKELADLQGDDDAWRRTYESTHTDLLAAEKEIVILRDALLARCPRHCEADHEAGVCELTRREVAALAGKDK